MTAGRVLPVRVLFVCTGNSARSQLGEALLQRMGGGGFHVRSAGIDPKGVHPNTLRVLAARGIHWSSATSDPISTYVAEPWDVVITVCDRARQSCPVFPGGGTQLHWGLEDPAEADGPDAQRLAAFERTARELEALIGPFVERIQRQRYEGDPGAR